MKISLASISVLNVLSAYQPRNVYPVLLASASSVVVYAVSYVLSFAVIAVPPSTLYVSLYVFAVHCAYNVIDPVAKRLVTLWLFVYVVPVPSAFVFQFLNVQPVKLYPFAVNAFATSYVCVDAAVLPLNVPVAPFVPVIYVALLL